MQLKGYVKVARFLEFVLQLWMHENRPGHQTDHKWSKDTCHFDPVLSLQPHGADTARTECMELETAMV